MNNFVNIELRHCFDYFYDNFSRDDGTYGLMPDKVPDIGRISSIAANAFVFVAMAAGADFGFITKDEAEQICIRALETHKKLEREQGFYYHFYFMNSGERAHRCELSIIDSALFFAGALAAGGYFGGRTLELARELYLECNWEYFYCPNRKMFRMSKYDSGFTGYWDVYAEQLIVYFLAAGSHKGKKIARQAYDSFARLNGEYGGVNFIYTWFGSLFTHQFSHAFIDFKGYIDGDGVNWFDNSVKATLANRQFCMDNADKFRGYGPDGWGLTSCLTSEGYIGRIGTIPSGNGNSENLSNGTIAPCGAIGAVVFTPDESLSALKHFYNLPGLVSKYGLKDAYNEDEGWFSDSYISIDKGISIAMLANYLKHTVWNSFCSLPEVIDAYNLLGFKKEN